MIAAASFVVNMVWAGASLRELETRYEKPEARGLRLFETESESERGQFEGSGGFHGDVKKTF